MANMSAESKLTAKHRDIGDFGFSRTRRVDDAARLARIQDAKWRTVGMDLEALTEQIGERKTMEKAEEERDLAYTKMADYFDNQVCALQSEQNAIKAEMYREMQRFRLEEQRPDMRREWDLNNPDYLKNSTSARVGDDDPNCGPSSLLKFAGEDLTADERKKLQSAQQVAWSEQQVAEKAAIKADEDERERLYDDLRMKQAELAGYIEAAQDDARKQLDAEMRDTNKALAEARKQREQWDKEQTKLADEIEAQTQLNSNILTENPHMGVSSMDPYRPRNDHYKGMDPVTKEYIRQVQLNQIEDAANRKKMEAQEEADWAREQALIHKAMQASQQRKEDFMTMQKQAVLDFLKVQAKEKEERDAKDKTMFDTQVPSADYFNQFGRTHR